VGSPFLILKVAPNQLRHNAIESSFELDEPEPATMKLPSILASRP